MATFAQLSKCWQIALDRYTFAKQSYGVVVPDALSDARRLPVAQELQRMVRQPSDGDGRGHL